MQQHRKTGLVLVAISLLCLCIGFVWAKSAAIVGMVTETQSHAYWQNDSKKNQVQELVELPENSKLVLTKASKLTVVYLASGQQYELKGPALVQFKFAKPVALNGAMPKTIGATPVLTEKTKIDPKKVQTAGQTLVSTEALEDSNEPVGYAAAPPPPPPPPPPPAPSPAPVVAAAPPPAPVPAMSPSRPSSSLEAAAMKRMQAYEAAKRKAESEAMAARQETASMRAEREAARLAAEAAYAAERGSEKTAADAVPKPACPPPVNDNDTGIAQSEVTTTCSDIED